jgi:hypothetical protein
LVMAKMPPTYRGEIVTYRGEIVRSDGRADRAQPVADRHEAEHARAVNENVEFRRCQYDRGIALRAFLLCDTYRLPASPPKSICGQARMIAGSMEGTAVNEAFGASCFTTGNNGAIQTPPPTPPQTK